MSTLTALLCELYLCTYAGAQLGELSQPDLLERSACLDSQAVQVMLLVAYYFLGQALLQKASGGLHPAAPHALSSPWQDSKPAPGHSDAKASCTGAFLAFHDPLTAEESVKEWQLAIQGGFKAIAARTASLGSIVWDGRSLNATCMPKRRENKTWTSPNGPQLNCSQVPSVN